MEAVRSPNRPHCSPPSLKSVRIRKNMHLNSGTLLQGGKYRIEKVLGQGSFGITYLATTRINGPLGEISVKVAIKEFFSKDMNMRKADGSVSEMSSGSLSGKYAAMFQREAKHLSHLEHKGIVNVLESFSENNTHYYVMEYIDGGSLDDHILRSGRLSESDAITYALQISDALSFMHSHNMLHLDLKPKNIMLRSDGTLCLIDFGLSKQYDSNGEPESSTSIGLGTPGYAPLEQGSGDYREVFDPTLDVYAFGATIFKMLTGKTPPHASSIMNEGFPENELLVAGISDSLVSAIRFSMSPRRRDRPQSVSAFEELFADNDSYDSTIIHKTDFKDPKMPGSGALPVGYKVLSPRYSYEILSVHSEASCYFSYVARCSRRDGGYNDTCLEVLLYEMYPNCYVGVRHPLDVRSYEFELSLGDYDKMRSEFDTKVEWMKKNPDIQILEDFFLNEYGDPDVPFVSFIVPDLNEMTDNADSPVEYYNESHKVMEAEKADNNNDEPIWKLILDIIDVLASFVFPIFGFFICIILFGIGGIWCAFISFLVSSISAFYAIRLRKDFRYFWVLLIIYVPIVVGTLMWIADIIGFMEF